MTRPIYYCKFCVHCNQDGTCLAYPEGIPLRVMDEGHVRPWPGDHGLRFKALPGTPAIVRRAVRKFRLPPLS